MKDCPNKGMSDLRSTGLRALTLVTITKDDRAGLTRTLQSTAGLRALGAEHIVVLGGSLELDSSIEQGTVETIRWLHRPPQGIADAFNAGMEAASSEWIWFLNGGDAVHESLDPSWLLTLLTETKSDAVFGAIHFDGETAPRSMPHLRYQWPFVVCWPFHPAAIVRRDALHHAGGFDRRWRVAMDYELWFRILKRVDRVDVLSVCFARFDTKGISERSETNQLAKREAACVLIMHSGVVVRDMSWMVARTLWKCLRSLMTVLGLR